MSTNNFNKNGKKVSIEDARRYIANYQNEEKPPLVRTISMLIDRNCIENILEQEKCYAVRLFMAKTSDDDSGQYTVVVVGTDKDGHNLTSNGEIYEELTVCPPNCGEGGSVL